MTVRVDFKSLVFHCNFKSQQRAIPLHLHILPKPRAFSLTPPLSDPGLRSLCFQNRPWYTAQHKGITALCYSLAASCTLVWVSTAKPWGLWGQDPRHSLPTQLTDLTGVADTDKHAGHCYILSRFWLAFERKSSHALWSAKHHSLLLPVSQSQEIPFCHRSTKPIATYCFLIGGKNKS